MARITFEDGIWSNVMCEKCNIAHKVMTAHMISDYECPYCYSKIHLEGLPDARTVSFGREEGSLLDKITKIGIDAAKSLQDERGGGS